MKNQFNHPATKRAGLLMYCLMFALAAMAQAPQRFNYQTVVRNTSGVPQTAQTYTVRFSIRDLGATGTILYQETHSVTTNNFGLFNAAVGGGTVVSGSFASINWGSGDKYLQVEYKQGSNPYSDLGATQLISVPFALYAANGGGGGVGGSGTTNFVSKFTPNGTTLGNSLVFDNGTSVAIGTSSPHPSALLHLESSTQGFLMPRMDSLTFENIPLPANGLMVLDTTDTAEYDIRYYHKNSNTWKRIKRVTTNINNYYGGGGDHNTLDEAYDEGGPGQGRTIDVDAGAVELIGDGSSNTLEVRNGAKSGAEVTMTGIGSALRASNSTANARDLVHVIHSGTAGGDWPDSLGHAGYFKIAVTGNPRPALMGENRGIGFGVGGAVGEFEYPTDHIPRAGVGGFCMANSGPRMNGVTGFSRRNRGVYGRTTRYADWLLGPDTMFCGVYGTAYPDEGVISGTTDLYVGVAGRVQSGVGVAGFNNGDGHGVYGVTKGGIGGTASMAGVWGVVQEGAWDTHVADFPYLDTDGASKKGLVGVLAQSKSNVALWAEGQDKAGIVASVGSKSGSGHITAAPKTALIALARHGAAGAALFRQDTISTAPAVRILSQSAMQGFDLAHNGTGIGARVIKYDTTSTMDALHVENKGAGFAAHFKNTKSSNTHQTVMAINDGLGSAGVFVTQGNRENTSPALKSLHYGKGSAGWFEAVDSTVPVNANPLLLVRGNHKGAGVKVELNHVRNNNPAWSSVSPERIAIFETTEDTSDRVGIEVKYAGTDAALRIEGTRAEHVSAHNSDSAALLKVTTENRVAANFSNTGTAPSVAYGLPLSGSYTTAAVVNISSSSPGQTCLHVKPTHYTDPITNLLGLSIPVPGLFKAKAAVFEGPIEVDGGFTGTGLFSLGGSLTVTADITCSGTAEVDSVHAGFLFADTNAYLAKVNVAGTLDVGGNTTLMGLMVNGPLDCTGTVSANIKNFRIDHPLKPDYYLQHASIESNEAVNVYSGNITTDVNGYATVTLPDYVIAINTDYRYQLTVMGQSFARAIVSEEIGSNSHFTIRTDQPNVKVSWAVTGVRKDKWILEHPMQVELPKANVLPR